MHIMKIFNYHLMRYTIKCLTEINSGKNYSMRISQVQMFMNKLQKFEEIMGDRGTLEPTLARIKKGPNNWHKPVREKSLENFAQEGCFPNVPESIFRRGRVLFWKRYLVLNHPLPWILECIQYRVKYHCHWGRNFTAKLLH